MSYVTRPGFSGVFDDALARGQQLASKESLSKGWNKVQAEGYAYLYARGTELYQALQNTEVYKRVVQGSNALYDVGTSGFSVTEKISESRKSVLGVDAAGVTDVAFMANKFVKGISSFLNAVGAPTAAQEAAEWGGLATGCAAMIASGSLAGPWGTAAGGIACALSAIVKLFSYLGDSYKAPEAWVPHAVFVPTRAQHVLIQADAARLASVLRYWYGQTSFAGIADRLQVAEFIAKYPPPPPLNFDGTFDFSNRTNDPIPALDLKLMLHALDFPRGRTDADMNVNRSMQVMHGIRFLYEPTGSPSLVWHWYMDEGDLNVTAVNTGAAIARARTQAQLPTDSIDWNPWCRLDELLNFFSAVCRLEVEASQAGGPAIHEMFLRSTLPVRQYSCLIGGKRYDPRCFTALQHSDGRFSYWGSEQEPVATEALLNRVWNLEEASLKEYAAIRLKAAMSQLYLYWEWSKSTVAKRADAIAAVAPPTDAVGWRMTAPVNPRQMQENGQLNSEEQAGVLSSINQYSTTLGKVTTVATWPVFGTPAPQFWAARDGAFIAQLVRERRALMGPVIDAVNQAVAGGTGDVILPNGQLFTLPPGATSVGVCIKPGCPLAADTFYYKNANGALFGVHPDGAIRGVIDPASVAALNKAANYGVLYQPKIEFRVAEPAQSSIGSLVTLAGAALLAIKLFGK